MTRSSLIALIVLTTWLCCTPAQGIEFVTKDQFKSATGGYKDYPFRVLFQKLSQSQGAERQRIRTAIIQRQVFDRKMKKRVEDGTVKYQKFFGIVREISEEKLVLWDAQAQAERTFYSGLLGIPTLDPDHHQVSTFNINGFAVVVYSLDDRLYQLEIGFPLTVPDHLQLSREGSQNLLRWAEPPTLPKPMGYHVQVNGEAFKSIDATEVRIPRKPDQADEYTVRAVYRHGPALVESQPSATLFDSVTADELAQIRQAEQAYALLLSTLNPASWEGGRQILQENLPLFSTRLDQDRQAVVMGLSRFFADIDEGDRLAGLTPLTEETLAQSTEYYEAALEKGRHLAPEVDVVFVAKRKIEEIQELRAHMSSRSREMMAGDTLDKVVNGLTPEGWERARDALIAQKDLLVTHLTGPKLVLANELLAFFAEIDAGDALVATPGAGQDELTRAVTLYQQARRTGHVSAPAQATLDLIVDRRAAAAKEKLSAIHAQNRQELARGVFQEVLAGLTPEKWPEARDRLYAQRDLLTTNLDETRRLDVAGMLKFFSDIEAGDSLARLPSPSAGQVAKAVAFYQSARQSALSLSPTVNLGFIADIKIDAGQRMIQAIEDKSQALLARKTLERVILGLTPDTWQQARQSLMDNRELLLGYLEAGDVANVNRLMDFFATIDAGDAFAAASPTTLDDLQRAQNFYREAGTKAQSLTDIVSIGFIAELRRSETDKRLAELAAQNQALLAEQSFERILSDLNPARWRDARQALMDQRALFESGLDAESERLYNQLVAFFSEIEKGDGFRALKPVSLAMLDKALGAYETAAGQASALGRGVSLSFLTQLKSEEVQREKEALLAQASMAQAGAVYDEIVSKLTPSQWPSARKLMVGHGPLLKSSLRGPEQETMAALERFFSEIEEGDRLASIQPATRANLDNAAMFFRRAQEKAETLPPPLDVKFLAAMRLNEIDAQIAAQEAYERRLAEQAAEQQAARKAGKPVRPAKLSGKEAVQYAIKDFNTGNYSMALKGFTQVYHKQIRMMGKRGMKRLQGVMGLPDKYRAEIVFLVELKNLVAKSATLDQMGLEDEVQALSSRIFDGRGMWGIISQDRRDKMANRLENIRFESSGG